MEMMFIKPSEPLAKVVQYYFIYKIAPETLMEKFPDGMKVLPNTYGRLGIFFEQPSFKIEKGKNKKFNPQIGASGF